jgi:cell division protein FtsL
MTAVQQRRASHGMARLRVIAGKQRTQHPHVAPWMAFTLVVVVALFGIVTTQTSLDSGAFELAELHRSIADAQTENQHLRLEVARLESPARIAPIAAEMGLVYPDTRRTVMVDGVIDQVVEGDQRWASIAEFATEELAP